MVNPPARTVCRSGEPVALTAKEFDLLLYFLRNPNQALQREQIYQHVWHEPYPARAAPWTSMCSGCEKSWGWRTCSSLCTGSVFGWRCRDEILFQGIFHHYVFGGGLHCCGRISADPG